MGFDKCWHNDVLCLHFLICTFWHFSGFLSLKLAMFLSCPSGIDLVGLTRFVTVLCFYVHAWAGEETGGVPCRQVTTQMVGAPCPVPRNNTVLYKNRSHSFLQPSGADMALQQEIIRNDISILRSCEECIIVRLQEKKFKTNLNPDKKYDILRLVNSSLSYEETNKRLSLVIENGQYVLCFNNLRANNRHLAGICL